MTDRELMQQALDLLDDINQCSLPPTGIPLPAEIDHVIESLRARLAQPESAPTNNGRYLTGYKAQPEPEPVAVWELQESGWDTIADADWMETLPVGTKLYTAPPRKEWQSLTDENIEDACWTEVDQRLRSFARAIEAKLKEKNSAPD